MLIRNGNWPQLEGLGLSIMKDVKEQNVCDMGNIPNPLIYYIQKGFNYLNVLDNDFQM